MAKQQWTEMVLTNSNVTEKLKRKVREEKLDFML